MVKLNLILQELSRNYKKKKLKTVVDSGTHRDVVSNEHKSVTLTGIYLEYRGYKFKKLLNQLLFVYSKQILIHTQFNFYSSINHNKTFLNKCD